MHKSIKTRTCCRLVLVLSLLLVPAWAEQQGSAQQQPSKGKSEWDGEAGAPPTGTPMAAPQQQCQPEKINQLFQEIIKCQAWKRPTAGPPGFPQPGLPGGVPPPPMGPRAYPGAPSGGRGAEEFDFLNRGGPAFLSGSGGQAGGGGGVLVSRPIPADVRPILGDGIPDGSQFFIAGPRMRPNAFPTFGGAGRAGPKVDGWPLIISPGPSGSPQDGSNAGGQGGSGAGGQTPEDIIRGIAESFGGSSTGGGGGQQGGAPGGSVFNFRSTSNGGFGGSPFGGSPFGGLPFGGSPFGGGPFGGSPFGGGPSISTGPDGNTFELDFTSSGPGDIDFNEILRILKGLQAPEDPNSKGSPGADGAKEGSGADGAKEGSGADGAPASRSGEPHPDTTDGIIEVDTTTSMNDMTTDETATAATTNPEMP